MTTLIKTATSSIVSMATDDVIYVAATGSIIKTSGGAAIQSSSAVPAKNASVVIDGLVARLAAPQVGFTAAVIATAYSEGDSGSNTFSIGQTGVVRSNTDGFLLRDANDTVDSLGLIDVQGTAISMDRGGTVINAGAIFAADAVIVIGGTTLIRNFGQIITTATGITSQANNGTLTNSGSITATVTGIALEGGTQTLSNTGTLSAGISAIAVTGLTAGRVQSSGELHATALTGTALLVTTSKGLTLDLSGLITAGAYGVFAEDSVNLKVIQAAAISAGTTGIKMLAADGLRLENSGAVAGGLNGMALAGNNAALTNSGDIQGLSGDGVQAQGAIFTLHNTGSIEGAGKGVSYTGSSLTGGYLLLDNGSSGVIHGGAQGVVVAYTDVPGPTVQTIIHNAGEISGRLAAIQITGLPMSLHNSGTIFASQGPAITVTGEQNMRIVNTGVIETSFGDTAINLAGTTGGGVNVLQNYGQIIGSVLMGDQLSTVRNHGLIAGDVNLDLGNDIYDGRGGEVTGAVLGQSGNDQLTGGSASDALFGGDGLDTLRGGAGDDLLYGGLGRDVLTGNAGADVFVFERAGEVSVGLVRDHIADFESGVDRIDFSFGAEQSFIGADAFDGHAGQIRYLRGAGVILGDIDGDRVADFGLVLDSHAILTAADFGL
ncbi:MAG: calcium-binding protein [Candidatus Saccharibacteria bacterium]|nr:calcium-binding protein [Pseudorhodobacter sp.]